MGRRLSWCVWLVVLGCYDYESLPAPARASLELGDAEIELPRAVTFDGKVLKDRAFNVFFVGADFVRFFSTDGHARIFQPASASKAAVFYARTWSLHRLGEADNLIEDASCGQSCFVDLSDSNANIQGRVSMIQLKAGKDLPPGSYQIELRVGTGGAANETLASYHIGFELLPMLSLPDGLTLSALGYADQGVEYPPDDRSISPQAITGGQVRLVPPQPPKMTDTDVIFTRFVLSGGEVFDRVELSAPAPAAGDTFLQATVYDSNDLKTPLSAAHRLKETGVSFTYDSSQPAQVSRLQLRGIDRYGQNVNVVVELASQ